MARVHKYNRGLIPFDRGHNVRPRAIHECARANNTTPFEGRCETTPVSTTGYARNAHVRPARLFVERDGRPARRQAVSAAAKRLDAAIPKNPKELGYGR